MGTELTSVLVIIVYPTRAIEKQLSDKVLRITQMLPTDNQQLETHTIDKLNLILFFEINII